MTPLNDHQKRHVSITGACGRVAGACVPILAQNYRVHLTDLRPRGPHQEITRELDILNRDAVLREMAGSAAIVHFAIASYDGISDNSEATILRSYDERMLEVNIQGTYHIFEAARVLKIPRVVFISSLTVALGDGRQTDCDVTLPPKPVNLYATTKLFGENLAELYHRKYGIKCFILRLGQPFPMGLPQEDFWRSDPVSAARLVTSGDIARAIDASLSTQEISFGIYNVVSPSSHGLINFLNGAEIGFFPKDRWEDWETSALL